MSSINNNNQKNQVDTTDLEFGSFNEEEDQFINKKQLPYCILYLINICIY